MDAEAKKKLVEAQKKKRRSLPILIMESDLFEWQSGVQMTLMVIALGQRTNPDARVPEDMPDTYKNDILGWCDFSQHRIALRAKKSESQVHKDIMMFEQQGIIKVRRWMDSNNTPHDMYQVNIDVIKSRQRPSQKRGVERPPCYREKSPNRGRFTSSNQPDHAKSVAAGNEDDA